MFQVWMDTKEAQCSVSLLGIEGDFGFSEFIAKPGQFLPSSVRNFERQCIAIADSGFLQPYTSFRLKLHLPPETDFFLQIETLTSTAIVQSLWVPGLYEVRSGMRKFQVRSLKNGMLAAKLDQLGEPKDLVDWVRKSPRRKNF